MANSNVEVPAAIPLPPYIAYDALTSDVPAYIIYERIMCSNIPDDNPIKATALSFCQEVHTVHNKDKGTVTIPSNHFTAHPAIEAKKWAATRARMCFPGLTPNQIFVPPAPAPIANPAPQNNATDIQALALTITAANAAAVAVAAREPPAETEDATFKLLGMCETDANSMLTMCGLEQESQYNSLPDWFTSIATKNMMMDGKHFVIKQLLTENL